MQITVDIVRRGLVGGFANPISGEEFTAGFDPQIPLVRTKKAELYQAAVNDTAALIFDMAQVYGVKSIKEYKALYASYLLTL